MREIKAFVGHSFSEVDAEVVGKFTKYFDSLARSHAQFSWQSAERAEPRILTEKVLRIIADKNTFMRTANRARHDLASVARMSEATSGDFLLSRISLRSCGLLCGTTS
jgi:hypothetical protein